MYSYDRSANRFDVLTNDERAMLRLLGQRKSDTVIRSALKVTQEEALRMANGIREKLGLSTMDSLRDVGRALARETH